MPTSFDVNYPQNPWEGMETKTRPWYVPNLYREYRRRAIYNRFVNVQFNMNGPKATEMYLDSIVMPHADFDPVALREVWLDSSYMDTFRRKIVYNRYAGKFSMNRYEDLVSYYLLDGVGGIAKLIKEGLGEQMTWVLDKLARNAFLKAPFKVYGTTATGTDFNSINPLQTVTTQLLQDIDLGMKERDVPYATNESGDLANVVCITTPGVIRDLRNEASSSGNSNAFIDVLKYADGMRIIRGEVGTYQGVRFISTNEACLYNAGRIIAQTTVTSPIAVGDGSPNPTTTTVDGLEYVGQPSKTHHIVVADSSDFSLNDRVTIHQDRTSANGITDGLDYTDGKAQLRRIVAIPDGTHLVFDRPILSPFGTDLGSGVYAYVTLGENIHTSLFLGGNDGVVMGVSQAPVLHTPPPIDDLDMIYRFSWDAYLGYQTFNKHVFELVLTAGSNRYVGARKVT